MTPPPPTLLEPRRVADDTDVLATHFALPGLGELPINAFLIHAEQPVLVDTGIAALADDLVAAVAARTDLARLKWIWLTHADPDHTGALVRLLELAPSARVVTSFLGMGKLGVAGLALAPDRVWLIRAGQKLAVGDRELEATRPPTFDAPETLAPFDLRSRVQFVADAFGVLLQRPVTDIRDVSSADLRTGAVTWGTIDNPWVHATERRALEAAIRAVDERKPTHVLGAHVPPAPGDYVSTFGDNLLATRDAPPFAGPDQHDLMAMLAAAA